jgi:hypothetical protein
MPDTAIMTGAGYPREAGVLRAIFGAMFRYSPAAPGITWVDDGTIMDSRLGCGE